MTLPRRKCSVCGAELTVVEGKVAVPHTDPKKERKNPGGGMENACWSEY